MDISAERLAEARSRARMSSFAVREHQKAKQGTCREVTYLPSRGQLRNLDGYILIEV